MVSELRVSLRELRCSWTEELNGEQLHLPAGSSRLSFQSLLDLVSTLHLARTGAHRPLSSILQEVESGIGAEDASSQSFLAYLSLVHARFTDVLQTLLHFGEGNASGIPAQILCSIERHWSGAAVQTVQEVFRDLARSSSAPCFVGDYRKVATRIEAVLLGRQTSLFWSRCRQMQHAICTASGGKIGKVQQGLPDGLQQLESALGKLKDAFEAAASGQQVALSTEDLDQVRNAVEMTQELFAFLSQRGGDGFDMVQRLVQAMTDVPGLAFLGMLVTKREQLSTRLAELVEGALTPETLDAVEQAAGFFMPMCIGALRVMDQDVDSRRFETVATYWSEDVRKSALQTRSIYGLGELVLRMLKEAHFRFGAKLPETLESLQSALRQGQVVQHKLQENDDDATAVSNTVHGLMNSGHLVLQASGDSQSLEVTAFFDFNGQKIYRDMQQLTECADKARLAMPQSGAGDSEGVDIFTSCVERAIGLRQELLELLQIGHPHNHEGRTLEFPSQGAGLSRTTLRELDDRLKWARDAVLTWRQALDAVRAECPLMSCIPARNAVKLAKAIIGGEWTRLPSLVSLSIRAAMPEGIAHQHLEDLFLECQRHTPKDGAFEDFLAELGRCLATFVEADMVQLSPLHQVAKRYPKTRLAEDATQKSRILRRLNPQIYPRRVLLIQEEESHEKAGSPLQSTASVTLLSAMLSLGVGPGPENVLHCDATTVKDDVLRFLHRVNHATQMASATGCQSDVVGVCVQVDRLAHDVLQVLLNRVDALHTAAGRRRESGRGAVVEVRLVFILTRHAPKLMIDTLEKDLCKQQPIKLLTHATLKRTLSDAAKGLCWHRVVSSDIAGNGKTYHIMNHPEWDRKSNATLVWGGAQTRGQAALELKKAIATGARCLHLELHPFEEGNGVNIDLLVCELIVFGAVYDPSSSEWAVLGSGTKLFVEVANSIKVRLQANSTELMPLMFLSAPLLKMVPGQWYVSAEVPFQFAGADLDPVTASPQALDFSLAGSALLLNDLRGTANLVGGGEENVVFRQTASAVVSGRHTQLVQDRTADVVQAAVSALRRARGSVVDESADDILVPSKSTINTFLRFLAEWTAKWANQLRNYQLTFDQDRKVDPPSIFIPVLEEMIRMAAGVCLRSAAAEAQEEQTRDKLTLSHSVKENSQATALQEAMAGRVVDVRCVATAAWAFNSGDSLRLVGSVRDVPKALQNMWHAYNQGVLRMLGERGKSHTIQPPPLNLASSNQAEMKKLLLQVMSDHGMSDAQLSDAFSGFVLTPDNMIKLVDVAERLRAGLPCILMGEAGCGKTVPWSAVGMRQGIAILISTSPQFSRACFPKVLLRLMAQLLGAGKLNEHSVHAGTSVEEIFAVLNDAEAMAQTMAQTGKHHMVIQFWDELNTCPHQPLFKQIIVDRVNPSTGRSIHKSVRFVAACNPWRYAPSQAMSAGFESPPIAEDRLAGLAYRVHPLPESLFGHLSSFGQLDSATEAQYVEKMAERSPSVLDADDQQLKPPETSGRICHIVARCVQVVHAFFRERLTLTASLRDPNRLLRLWAFIRWEWQKRGLNFTGVDLAKLDLQSLILAIHLCYELRLPNMELRQQLVAVLLADSQLGDCLLQHFHDQLEDEQSRLDLWQNVVREEEDYWLNAINVPDNIAKIRALRENVHAALMCSMTRTPIFILGKPGCSKSLTVSLLVSALTDPYSDELKHLASFSVQPYQGSRQSTSSSLLQVFDRALKQQEKLRKLKRRTRPLALVLLDEVGLAEQSPHNPLKVLHSRLEPRKPEQAVSVIAISNWELDRSKMSRALTLACPPASESDLQEIALAIIRSYLAHETLIRRQLEANLEHISRAFMGILQSQQPCDFHGLRDWYGMCSYAARLLLAADDAMELVSKEASQGALMKAVSDALSIEARQLVKLCRDRELKFVPADWALQMAVYNNFSGNSRHSDNGHQIVDTLSTMKRSVHADEAQAQFLPSLSQVLPESTTTVNRLDSLLGDVDGRHIMVITDSPVPMIAWIEHRARTVANWNPESLVGSPLEQDRTSTDMYAQSMIQAAIVSIAQERRLLILQNLSIIYAALYDVFNSNYCRAGGDGQRYCRIAREGFCNPRCAVAEQFKAVLVVTRERAAEYEPALLNRFAKLEADASEISHACKDLIVCTHVYLVYLCLFQVTVAKPRWTCRIFSPRKMLPWSGRSMCLNSSRAWVVQRACHSTCCPQMSWLLASWILRSRT